MHGVGRFWLAVAGGVALGGEFGAALVSIGAAAEPVLGISAIRASAQYPPTAGAGYAVVPTNTAAGAEWRCYRHGHHFLSVILDAGAFVLRPHPGVDRNGWGGSHYLQPFIAGAALKHTTVPSVTANAGGVAIAASGSVSRGDSGTYGVWTASLACTFDPATKAFAGTGEYAIALDGAVADAGGDLNLYKLANNYLDDVPLLSGATGDTGDMTNAVAVGHNFTKEWVPPMGGYYPQDWTHALSVTAYGNYNEVDTAAQGFCPIQSAYKPAIRIGLTTTDIGIPMIFGASYAAEKARDFTADNVGITPLIRPFTSETQFVFSVSIEAWAPDGDGVGVEADLAARFSDDPEQAEIFYSERLGEPFRRVVGALPRVAPGAYAGTVVVPFPANGGARPKSGFFIGRPPCAAQAAVLSPVEPRAGVEVAAAEGRGVLRAERGARRGERKAP